MVKVNPEKKTHSNKVKDFNYIWNMLKLSDTVLGNFVMVEKLNVFQRIYSIAWLLGISSIMFLCASTMYMEPKNLPIFFQSIAVLYMYGTAIIQNALLLKNKVKYMEVLNWCRTLEASERDNPHMMKAVIRNTKIIKYSFIYVAISVLVTPLITVFQPIIVGQLAPDAIHAKFKPVQPFILPVEDRDNWTVFLITCSIQAFGTFYAFLFPCFYYSMFNTFCSIYFAQMEIILDQINNLLAPPNDATSSKEAWPEKSTIKPKHDFFKELTIIIGKYCDIIRYNFFFNYFSDS